MDIALVGPSLAVSKKLFRYRKDEGGFTGWLANRLPHLSKTTAYRCIEIFKGVDPAMFPLGGNLTPKVLAEVSKAEPDVQALIAERIEAGEIFTAVIKSQTWGDAGTRRRPCGQLSGRRLP